MNRNLLTHDSEGLKSKIRIILKQEQKEMGSNGRVQNILFCKKQSMDRFTFLI